MICQKCGTNAPDGAIVCLNCGSLFQNNEPPKNEDNPQPKTANVVYIDQPAPISNNQSSDLNVVNSIPAENDKNVSYDNPVLPINNFNNNNINRGYIEYNWKYWLTFISVNLFIFAFTYFVFCFISNKYGVEIDNVLFDVSVITIISIIFEKYLQKIDEPWWGMAIPIYNFYLINKLCLKSGWCCLFVLFMMIPIFTSQHDLLSLVKAVRNFMILSYLYIIVLYSGLGARFGRFPLFSILVCMSFFPQLLVLIFPNLVLSSSFILEIIARIESIKFYTNLLIIVVFAATAFMKRYQPEY